MVWETGAVNIRIEQEHAEKTELITSILCYLRFLLFK